MSDINREALQKAVNRSGFALQMGLEAEIARTRAKGEHDWEIVAPEFPWRAVRDQRVRYLDLVLRRNIYIATVEFKRADESWVFLIPRGKNSSVSRFRCLVSNITSPAPGELDELHIRQTGSDYFDADFAPSSFEAEYCAMRSSKNKARLLESIAAPLVEATDAIAAEHYLIQEARNGKRNFQAMYFPMIVTTADLVVGRLPVEKISLEDGTIPADSTFERVDCIRFRKSLTQDLVPGSQVASLESAKTARDRTVVVVRAPALVKILGDWRGP